MQTLVCLNSRHRVGKIPKVHKMLAVQAERPEVGPQNTQKSWMWCYMPATLVSQKLRISLGSQGRKRLSQNNLGTTSEVDL